MKKVIDHTEKPYSNGGCTTVYLIEHILSDGSCVYNIEIQNGFATTEIECLDEMAAITLFHSLSTCTDSIESFEP